jgi:hypothetical protein
MELPGWVLLECTAMWSAFWNELREVAWVVSIVAALSIIGVAVGVALVVV